MVIMKTASPDAIVDHYKAVNALLTEVGYSTRRRAGKLGKSAQTLKQYSVSPGSAQHRQIPSQDLDLLRAIAIEEFWRATPDFLSSWAAAEGWEGSLALPHLYKVSDRQAISSDPGHFFIPRAQEIADETGGTLSPRLIRGKGYQPNPPLTDRARLRSRWRKAVFELRKKVKPDEFKPILTEITGHCEYNVLRIGIEYHPFRIPAHEPCVLKLEERVSA